MSLSEQFQSRAWSRVTLLALIAVAAAGCSDSARFGSTRSQYYQPSKPEVTGSVAKRPAAKTNVVAQPLPAPSKPQTVAASQHGVANGAQGLSAYRPAARSSDITGSVPTKPAPQPAGHWTWSGGKAVAVARGDTLVSIARTHGVPMSAVVEVNHIADPAALKPGQRLVIPRWVPGRQANAISVPPPAAVAPLAQAPAPRSGGTVHTVGRGDTLIGIARRNGMSLSALARHNNISPYTKLNVGDRVTIPSGHQQVASRTAPSKPAVPEPQIARPATQPAQAVASAPAETARVAHAQPEPQQAAPQDVTKTAEPAGAMPQFRWPVKGRIIARFGREPNGTQNDGINLAVPEGTPIKAAEDGVVAYAGNELKGYGNLVLVRHAGGYVSAYANASQLLVRRGDSIKRGQVIAHAGQTGNVTSPQLHFEIRKGSTPVDPTKYLGG
jgi:murein DD-endopeptidase MepM/ murein hydrolase activator NlpD